MKRILTLFCSSIWLLSLAACSSSPEISHSASAPESTSAQEDATAASEESGAATEEPENPSRQISVQYGDNTVIYALNDSQAATDLYQQLPLSLEVEDFSTNEKIFYPPEELDTSDAPLAEGGTGILAYYAPWGDVVMFYGDFSSNPSLYGLGQLVSGEEFIPGMSGSITIDRVSAA